jgi:hypothetical protein
MSQTLADQARRPRASATQHIVIGGTCGLAWAAGLRGFMAEIAGSSSSVTWYGTFAQVLLPGVIVGALLGWAEYIRRTGGRRRWRWLAAAPLLFTIAVFVSPEVIAALLHGQPPLAGGIGGGAIAIPLFGLAGGYALSGRGPRWARVLLGVVAVAPVPAWVFASSSIGPALTTPRGAWVALLFYSFIATLDLACAIPHRPVLPAGSQSGPSQPAADAALTPTQ